MNEFWDKIIWHNTIRDWGIALAIISVILLLLRIFQSVVIKRIKIYSAKTKTTIDDYFVSLIQSYVMPVLYVLAVYWGLNYINMPVRAERVMHVALLFIVTYFILKIVTSFIGFTFKKALGGNGKDELREKQANGILLIGKIIVWLIGLLFLVNNLGYDITTLIAGLGIGGIAIALAAQTILGDLFSYLVIFFDKPFEIGDFIIIQDKMGTVEYIGIKTTRLRTLSGEQLICSNTDLTNSRVHNYKRMQERRIFFSLGVVYNTSAEKLKALPQLIRKIIEELDYIRFDRAHFKSFGDFSLNFEVVYYILSPDFNTYMDKQQSINLKIFELFEKEQIEFAFPTQTIFLNKPVAEGMPGLEKV